ncbi:MAG: hypothetical protein V1902_00625 [Candidatus Falkowbacteria bacterium]
MKVILSRKGFDSAWGGYPSPILPNGKMISLPIPSDQDCDKYSDLKIDDGQTYFDLMKQLEIKIRHNGSVCGLTKNTKCHFDPDIYRGSIKRSKNWKPCFGQINQAQVHLQNEGVKKGDLFLFFGWFKQTVVKNGILQFDRSAPDLHIIWGYLQIGQTLQVNTTTKIPAWMRPHPHAKNEDRKKNPTNTIYIARDKLSWDENKSGAGVFSFDNSLVLTKDGMSKSRWDLPALFKKVEISYHSAQSWTRRGYFQSAAIGQEFVIEDNDKVENWAKQMFNADK